MSDFDYEALRERLKKDYEERIINDGWGRRRVADDATERYGFEVSRRQARHVCEKIRESAEEDRDIPTAVDMKVDEEAQKAKAVFEEVPDPDQLLAALGINEDQWKIDKCTIKPYQGQAKVDKVVAEDEEGDPITVSEQQVKQMYSAEVRLKPKHPAATERFEEQILEKAAERAPVYHSDGPANPQSENLQRVLIPDIHLGKDGFQSDWGIEKAKERVLSVVDELAAQGEEHNVKRICFPLGHDLLHIDREHISRSGTRHTTSSGTPVERTAPWIELFMAGCDLGEKMILRFLEVAPVDVPIIPGNHSETSEVAIGKYLMGIFRDSPDVQFDLTKERERYYRWGRNGFMDTHGDTCPWSDLAMNFANLNGTLWGNTDWHEVNTGHKHVTKTKPVGLSTNEGGAMLRISPSLSPQDAWHSKYHYHGTPGAESYIYNKDRPGPFASYQRYF